MRRSLVALCLAAAATGCDSTSERASAPSASPASPMATATPTHSPDPALPYEGDWTLVSGETPEGPIPVSERFPITMSMDGRGLGGRSSCNSYGGRFRIAGTAFFPGTFGSEQADCPNDRTLVAETRYVPAFHGVEQVAADETTLRLTGPGVELVFERLPAPDVDSLVDVTWVSGNETLRLSSEGSFRSTRGGCHVVVGTWEEATGRIVVPEARVTRDCPAAHESGGPVDASSGNFTFEVDGDRLTITFAGKSEVYRKR